MRATEMSMFFSSARATASSTVRSTRGPGVTNGGLAAARLPELLLRLGDQLADVRGVLFGVRSGRVPERCAGMAPRASAAANRSDAVLLTKCLQMNVRSSLSSTVVARVRASHPCPCRVPSFLFFRRALVVEPRTNHVDLRTLLGVQQQLHPVDHDRPRRVAPRLGAFRASRPVARRS